MKTPNSQIIFNWSMYSFRDTSPSASLCSGCYVEFAHGNGKRCDWSIYVYHFRICNIYIYFRDNPIQVIRLVTATRIICDIGTIIYSRVEIEKTTQDCWGSNIGSALEHVLFMNKALYKIHYYYYYGDMLFQ